MRTWTTAEEHAYDTASPSIAVRVQIADGTGTLRDWTNLDGSNHIGSVEWGDSLQQPFGDGAATIIWRRTEGDNMSPFVSGGRYQDYLDAGREIVISTKVYPPSADPDSFSWHEDFRGIIGDFNLDQHPGKIQFRDKIGTELQDQMIMYVKEYSTGSLLDVEDVITAILTDHDLDGSNTLYTPVTTGLGVTQYKQQMQPIMDACKVLAHLGGWDIRPVWHDATSAFRLTLYEPDRTTTTSQHTVPANHIHSYGSFSYALQNVRNWVKVTYGEFEESPEHSREYVERLAEMTPAHDPTGTPVLNSSIDRFGRKAMVLHEGASSLVKTEADAQALADAALSDLADPTLLAGMNLQYYFWPVELNDFYTFGADGVRFDTDQKMAIHGYRHSISTKKASTTLTLQGKPAIGYGSWLAAETGRAGQSSPMDDLAPPTPTVSIESGRFEVTIDIGYPDHLDYEEVLIHRSTNPLFTPSDANLVWVGRATKVTMIQPLGVRNYYKVRMRDRHGNMSESTGINAGTALGYNPIDLDDIYGTQPAAPPVVEYIDPLIQMDSPGASTQYQARLAFVGSTLLGVPSAGVGSAAAPSLAKYVEASNRFWAKTSYAPTAGNSSHCEVGGAGGRFYVGYTHATTGPALACVDSDLVEQWHTTAITATTSHEIRGIAARSSDSKVWVVTSEGSAGKIRRYGSTGTLEQTSADLGAPIASCCLLKGGLLLVLFLRTSGVFLAAYDADGDFSSAIWERSGGVSIRSLDANVVATPDGEGYYFCTGGGVTSTTGGFMYYGSSLGSDTVAATNLGSLSALEDVHAVQHVAVDATTGDVYALCNYYDGADCRQDVLRLLPKSTSTAWVLVYSLTELLSNVGHLQDWISHDAFASQPVVTVAAHNGRLALGLNATGANGGTVWPIVEYASVPSPLPDVCAPAGDWYPVWDFDPTYLTEEDSVSIAAFGADDESGNLAPLLFSQGTIADRPITDLSDDIDFLSLTFDGSSDHMRTGVELETGSPAGSFAGLLVCDPDTFAQYEGPVSCVPSAGSADSPAWSVEFGADPDDELLFRVGSTEFSTAGLTAAWGTNQPRCLGLHAEQGLFFDLVYESTGTNSIEPDKGQLWLARSGHGTATGGAFFDGRLYRMILWGTESNSGSAGDTIGNMQLRRYMHWIKQYFGIDVDTIPPTLVETDLTATITLSGEPVRTHAAATDMTATITLSGEPVYTEATSFPYRTGDATTETSGLGDGA